jgi:hypothetical protein
MARWTHAMPGAETLFQDKLVLHTRLGMSGADHSWGHLSFDERKCF